MAPILRRVVAMSPLRLRVLAGSEALDRPVRWVAVSELEDPTPFLEGGELVLTTGMRLRPGDAVPYVSRLIGLGAVGLGFGVGLGHDEVPETFVRAAAELGLPLIEVPRDVPFIAVGKAVSELLAAEQYDELSRAFAAQGRLTRAALQTDGARAVIDRLAREIDGWAALLDTSGDVRSAAGEGARRRAAALTPELDRLRARGTPASLAVSTPEEHVIVQPLGGHRRVRGFFAVGARRPFSPIAHTIVNAAGSLLTLALEQDGQRHEALAQSQARLRAAVLRLLIAGESAAAEEVLGHEPPREPVVVLVCRPGDPAALSRVVPGLAAPWGPEHTEHTTGDSAGDPADRLVVVVVAEPDAERAIVTATEHGPVGVSAPMPIDGIATGIDQARRALLSADPVMRFPDLAGQGLLSLLDPSAAAVWSRALLAPLRGQGERGDLVESLRAYLSCNGHWDAAARLLGIHRHTLRYRIRKVTERLRRDLDDPATRAELWAAIEIDAGGVSSW